MKGYQPPILDDGDDDILDKLWNEIDREKAAAPVTVVVGHPVRIDRRGDEYEVVEVATGKVVQRFSALPVAKEAAKAVVNPERFDPIQARRAARKAKRERLYSDDQPRVPAGSADGGQWTSGGGGGGGAREDKADDADKKAGAAREEREKNLKVPRSTIPLDDAQRAVEERAIAEFERDPAAMVNKYMDKFGYKNGSYFISADEAKELFADYSKDNDSRSLYAPAVHEAASLVAKLAYQRALEAPVEPGHNPAVLFTMGGPGAGKSSGLKADKSLEEFQNTAHIVYDTTMSGQKSSMRLLDQAIGAGFKPMIIYTAREVEDAYVNSVIPRAIENGRTVPLSYAINTYDDVDKNYMYLRDHYKGRATFVVIDNTRGRGNAARVWEPPKGKPIDRAAVQTRIRARIDKLFKEGKLRGPAYRGLRGTDS